MYDPIIYRYIKAPRNLVARSRWQAERIKETYGQDSWVGGNWVNTGMFQPSGERSRRFLFLGKISSEKGVHLAIKYARELGVELDVVGGAIPTEIGASYQQEMAQLCDGKQIAFHFNVTEQEKLGFLQHAKAVVYPVQQDEAHWLCGIETWACNVITLTFDRGAMREILTDGKHVAGLAVPGEKSFKVAWRTFATDVPQSHINPRGVAEHLYDRRRVVDRYLEVYKKVNEGLTW